MKANLVIALFFGLVVTGCNGQGNAAGRTPPDNSSSPMTVKVEMGYPSDGCSFQYSPVNFCDDQHLALITEALARQKPNFNRRYILLTISERPEYHQSSLVAIDPASGETYPVPIDAFSGHVDESGDPTMDGTLTYSLDSNKVCIEGAILAYKAIKNGKFCFTLQGKRFTGYQTPYME